MDKFKKIFFKPETFLVVGVVAVLAYIFFPKADDSGTERSRQPDSFSQMAFEEEGQKSSDETAKINDKAAGEKAEKKESGSGNPNASQNAQLFPGSEQQKNDHAQTDDLAEKVEGINVILSAQRRKNESQSSEIIALKSEIDNLKKSIDLIKNDLSDRPQKTKISSTGNVGSRNESPSRKKVSSSPSMALKEIHGDHAWIKYRERVYVVSPGDNIGDIRIRDVKEASGQVITSNGVLQ